MPSDQVPLSNGILEAPTSTHTPGARKKALGPKWKEEADGDTNVVATLSKSYEDLLIGVGEDPTRDGLLKTPSRAAKALLYFTKGYEENVDGMISLFPFYFSLVISSLFSDRNIC